LHAWGSQPEQIPALIDDVANASSMKSNPMQLTTEELTEIAERSI
jgi:alcohol dehydrogenase class IV